MHQNRTTETSGRWMGNIPVRSVYALSNKASVNVGIAKPLGVPDVAFKIICDAYNKRCADASLGIPPGEQDAAYLLRRLATLRAPFGSWQSDPIFWQSRVWWAIRQATLSLDPLRSGDNITPCPTAEEWDAVVPISAKTMAVWAYRRWDRDERLHSVCRQLHHEGYVSSDYTIPDYSTCHRIYWYAAARGICRKEWTQRIADSGIRPAWRKDVSTRQGMSESLEGRV